FLGLGESCGAPELHRPGFAGSEPAQRVAVAGLAYLDAAAVHRNAQAFGAFGGHESNAERRAHDPDFVAADQHGKARSLAVLDIDTDAAAFECQARPVRIR